MHQFVRDRYNEDAVGHLVVLEQGVDANERVAVIQRKPNQPKPPLPRVAIRDADLVHAWYIREVALPDAIERGR
jgi:hypothetical protein